MSTSQLERNQRVILHLRIRVNDGKREEFLAFLRKAAPFYEKAGGIQIRFLQSVDDPDSFVEGVEYEDLGSYERDKVRVESDPEMKAYLQRWRTLLDGPVQLEMYQDLTNDIHESKL